MSTHELKTWPEPFAAILDGSKRHEVRKNDRGYAVGDELHLREWQPEPEKDANGFRYAEKPWRKLYEYDGYTGRDLRARVTHLTPGGSWGLPADLCVMSIEPVTTLDRGNGPEPVLRSFVSKSYAADPRPQAAAVEPTPLTVVEAMNMPDVYGGVKHVVFTTSNRARTVQRFRYHDGEWQTLGDGGFVTFTCLRTRDMFERATLVDAEPRGGSR